MSVLQKSLDGLSPVTTRLASGFWLCLDGVNQDALLDAKKNDAYSGRFFGPYFSV